MFHYCSALTEINIPDNVKTIEYSAFSGCTSLKTISLPESLIRIDKYCFSNCNSLEHIVLPDGITKLTCGIFAGCENLASVQFPLSLETIEGVSYEGNVKGVFEGCNKLRELNSNYSSNSFERNIYK